MKKVCYLFLLLFFYIPSYSQGSFDQSLNELSTDISQKLILRNKKRMAVLYITDINKNQTNAGKYIADLISVNLVNSSGNFEVFDRDNLSNIVEVKKLISDGFIDAAKAKELGDILAVETIITGYYTVLANKLKLSVKALDVNGGFTIAAAIKDLPLTADACSLLGINCSQESGDLSNRGFNTPVQSNEGYNNPQTVNKECELNMTGDYCFMNNTSVNLTVTIMTNMSRHQEQITLSPLQTQCFYNIAAGSYNYEIIEKGYTQTYSYRTSSGIRETKPLYDAKGQIKVEQCKSKTFLIK